MGCRRCRPNVSERTDANGPWGATLVSTVAANAKVTATFAGPTAWVPVTVGAGSSNVAISSLVASPNLVLADDVSAMTLTATWADRLGKPLAVEAVARGGAGPCWAT